MTAQAQKISVVAAVEQVPVAAPPPKPQLPPMPDKPGNRPFFFFSLSLSFIYTFLRFCFVLFCYRRCVWLWGNGDGWTGIPFYSYSFIHAFAAILFICLCVIVSFCAGTEVASWSLQLLQMQQFSSQRSILPV